MGSLQCFDEIDELMFDLHTRGCKVGDKQTNEWCDEYKSQVENKIKEYGTFRAKEYLKEFLLICSSKDIQILQDSLKEVIQKLESKQIENN